MKVAVCPHQSSPLGLPPNLKLVCPAYLIAVSPEIPFIKPVKVSINALQSLEGKAAVTFVSTHKTVHHEANPQPSITALGVLQGGDFNLSTGVGTITLDHLPTIIAIACVVTAV